MKRSDTFIGYSIIEPSKYNVKFSGQSSNGSRAEIRIKKCTNDLFLKRHLFKKFEKNI